MNKRMIAKELRKIAKSIVVGSRDVLEVQKEYSDLLDDYEKNQPFSLDEENKKMKAIQNKLKELNVLEAENGIDETEEPDFVMNEQLQRLLTRDVDQKALSEYQEKWDESKDEDRRSTQAEIVKQIKNSHHGITQSKAEEMFERMCRNIEQGMDISDALVNYGVSDEYFSFFL